MDDTTEHGNALHYSDYILVLRKRWRVVFLVTLLGIATAVYLISQAQPRYEATGRLTVQPITLTGSLSGERRGASLDTIFHHEQTINTHLELMLSRPVLERVLNSQPETSPPDQTINLIGRLKANVRQLLNREQTVLSPEELLSVKVSSLRGNFKVSNVPYTNIIEITAQHSEPDKASSLANDLAHAYIQYDISNNQRSSENSFQFLSDQAAEYKIKLEDAEAKFLAFRRDSNLFSLSGIQESVANKIREYGDIALDTRTRLQQLTIRLDKLKSSTDSDRIDYGKVRSIITNPVIEDLNRDLINAQIERSNLLEVYRSKNPKIIAILSRISDLQQEISTQVDKEIASMENEQFLLQAELATLLENIEELKTEALEINKKAVQYGMLERDVSAFKKYYDTLMVKMEDSTVSSDVRSNVTTISFVEQAAKPLGPVNRNNKKMLLMGVFGGLFSGILAAFFLEYSDRTISTEDDIRHNLDLPVLGSIPTAPREILKTLSSIKGDPSPG